MLDYAKQILAMDTALRVDKSFDLVKREMMLDGKKAALYFIDGLIKDEIMEKLMEYFMGLPAITPTFEIAQLPYVETEETKDLQKVVTAVLSGTIALLMESFSQTFLIDARTYPVRGIVEPENDKVLRGSHDGFVETILFNTGMLRRRIRDPALTMEHHTIGTKSKTDVVLCYMDQKADSAFVTFLQEKLAKIEVPSLVMGQESLAECLIRTHWYNPFPKIRYTERPDTAAASVLEGNILLFCDNSPVVMLLPTSIFDFMQETDDYYFPPLTGTYLRLVRIAIFLITLFLTPTWYLLLKNPNWIPAGLSFLLVQKEGAIPIILQLFLIEFAIDGLKMASLNTPSVLNNSLSVVGGLILGDFAVQIGWFVPETILYMAFVAIANFTQPSYELGYAFKFMRLLLLLLTAIANVWGFGVGILLILVLVATNKTVNGKRNYLYPLLPWNGKAMRRLLFRVKL